MIESYDSSDFVDDEKRVMDRAVDVFRRDPVSPLISSFIRHGVRSRDRRSLPIKLKLLDLGSKIGEMVVSWEWWKLRNTDRIKCHEIMEAMQQILKEVQPYQSSSTLKPPLAKPPPLLKGG